MSIYPDVDITVTGCRYIRILLYIEAKIQRVKESEELENKQLTFDLAVYDAGVPQFSAMASVVVNIENLNDESPIFELPQGYSVSIPENSPAGKIFESIQK